ncbi:Phage protein [plant metagenome]|uniref:Phage protein n=1 Tax=plant metagenome TaxID=1297885 RepID=A0A484QQQ4_9ZZZZ
MIPGINLLALAGGVIAMQTAQWRRFKSRAQNGRGLWVNEFDPDVPIRGSWQPVGESTIRDLGLDTSKRYFNLYTSNPIDNVQRGEAPDQIVYGGRLHDVVGHSDWYAQDGWRGIMCVDVGPA